jgi:LysR family transcriptional regulator for metE and metH
VHDIAHLPTPRLEVRDLRVVLALAAAGSTAQAASSLHLTQPAVSRALLSAEDRLGTKLFERTPKGLVLTSAGERLAAGAARLLVELGDLEHRTVTPATTPARIRVVCQCYTAYHWLPSALVSLRAALPQLEIALAVEHTDGPVEALAAGKIDVALLTSAPLVGEGLVERKLFADEVVFIVSASHPLARKKTLTPADLRQTPLVTATAASRESEWFMTRVFGRARPRLRFERLPLTEAILDVTRAGMGIAILSEWIVSPHLGQGDLVVKRLSAGPLMRPWRLAWRREVDDAARRLLGALQASVPRARLAG